MVADKELSTRERIPGVVEEEVRMGGALAQGGGLKLGGEQEVEPEGRGSRRGWRRK